MKMNELIAAIVSKHKKDGIDVNPPASIQAIEAFERKIGFSLPADFVEFYSVCNGFTCTEDIFNMKTLEDITAYQSDFGVDWFHFSDYMISSDVWSLRKKASGDFEIINSGEVTITLTSSLYTFLERFLKGNVFETDGLYNWHDELKALGNVTTPLPDSAWENVSDCTPVSKQTRHIIKTLHSSIAITAPPETIWENITNVKIEQFSDPFIFKLLNIPKPLSAEVISEGKGGRRVAYFDTGKKFMQEIIEWKPFTEYSFSFNPEKGFRVCYFFELSEGVFRIPSGAYLLTTDKAITTLQLSTTYSIDKRLYFLFNLPVRIILKAFQRYLLTSIKKNSQ